jgi:hypothetical protein
MQTTDQVVGEAREKLDESEIIRIMREELDWPEAGDPDGATADTLARIAKRLAALRAQPERGAEEMREPPPGLLMSMAMRYDHGLGMPGYYDQEIFQLAGSPAHILRLESALITMRQLWEEVTGNGFYKLSAEADYAARLAKLRALPLHPAKDEGGAR